MKRSVVQTVAAMGFLATGVIACQNAQGPCQQQYSRGAEVRACVVGAQEIGPSSKNIREADRACAQRYDIRTVDPSDPNAFDKASAMADLYNACHNGAKASMVYDHGQDAGTVNADGCEQIMIGGTIQCR